MRRIDVGPRPARRDGLAEWYTAALGAQAASGLSMAEYAATIGVAAPTLYQWRRRLAGVLSDGGRETKLVEVAVAQAAPHVVGGMVVRLCAGRRSIEVSPGFDGEDLRRLVAVLESC